MNRRKLAIAVIVADVAENGIAGKTAMRAYVENRLSYQTFQAAIRTGLAIHNRKRGAVPVESATGTYWTK